MTQTGLVLSFICHLACTMFNIMTVHLHVLVSLGNLALSRALGDFCFKKNDKKSAEEQIVTGININY